MPCSLQWEEVLRQKGAQLIAGVDEAGRGPLAGPVVAAAVILPDNFHHPLLDDSKKLSPANRERLFEELFSLPGATIRTGISTVEEIDSLNILRATHQAMRRAVLALPKLPDHVLIDGLPVAPFPVPQTALVKGDSLSFSIAAASIIAKVSRDRQMAVLDREYPEYGFAKHKGYGTAYHLNQLRTHGPCPAHRKSFAPVSQQTFRF